MTYIDPHLEESFSAHWGKMFGHLGDRIDRLAMMKASADKAVVPVFGRHQRTNIANANGICILDFDGPDQGHYWYVKSITVGGTTPTTVAAGRADTYISAMDFSLQSSLTLLGMLDWRDQTLALPNIAFYGDGAMPMRMNEELLILVTNATPGQQYVGVVQFVDHQEASSGQEWPR